jgi:hypothetical protein
MDFRAVMEGGRLPGGTSVSLNRAVPGRSAIPAAAVVWKKLRRVGIVGSEL